MFAALLGPRAWADPPLGHISLHPRQRQRALCARTCCVSSPSPRWGHPRPTQAGHQDKEWPDEGQCSRYSELSYIADRGTQRRTQGESEPCFGVTAACPPNMGSQHILYYMRTLCPPLGIPRQTDHSHAFCRPGHTSTRAWKSKLCFGATAACPPNMGSQCVFLLHARPLCPHRDSHAN